MDESKEQTEQPTEQATTLTGARVPQDILTDTSTTLRLISNNTPGTKNTKAEW